MSHNVVTPHVSWVAAPLSVKGIFKCRPVLVSLAILQVWVKIINKVIVLVVQPVVKKAWTVVHTFLWWRHHTSTNKSRLAKANQMSLGLVLQ